MAKAAQAIFKKICKRNKLADDATIDGLLAEYADPADLIHHWIEQQQLSQKVGQQLLGIYQKKLEQHFASLTEEAVEPPDDATETPSQEAPVEAADPAQQAKKKNRARPKPSPADASDEAGAAAPPAAQRDAPSTAAKAKPSAADEAAGQDRRKAPAAAHDVTAERADPTRAPEKAAKPTAAVKPSATVKAVASNGESAAQLHPTIAKIMQAAVQHKASDIHITAGRSPVLRVAGALRELGLAPMSPDACRDALTSLLSDEQRERFDETLDIDFCFDGGAELGRFRTNYFVEKGGMDAVFRLISDEVPSMEELKLPDQIAKLTEVNTGIILVTGPKSSGKTTTLAAMIDLINRTRSEHILTIEDPIEFIHSPKKAYLTQREVGTHTDTFGTALTGAMHEAPDVIMVGELRDLETTSLVITAAETGFLVLTTLHTPDAIRTIGRILGVFPAREQAQIRSMLAKSLRGIVSQQLVPSTDGKSLELALEVLVNTPAIGNLIRENRTFQLPSLMQVGGRVGMVMMDDSLIRLARDGRISTRDALARAADDNKVRKELDIPDEH